MNCFWCARATRRTTRSRPEVHWLSRRWRAWRLTGAEEYRVAAEKALAGLGDLPYRYPLGFGSEGGLPSSWWSRLRRSWWWADEMIVLKPSSKPHARDSGPDASSRTQNGGRPRLPLFEGRVPPTTPLAWVPGPHAWPR